MARDDITIKHSFEEVDRHKRVPLYASIDGKFQNRQNDSMVLERQNNSHTWEKKVSGCCNAPFVPWKSS